MSEGDGLAQGLELPNGRDVHFLCLVAGDIISSPKHSFRLMAVVLQRCPNMAVPEARCAIEKQFQSCSQVHGASQPLLRKQHALAFLIIGPPLWNLVHPPSVSLSHGGSFRPVGLG